MRRSPSILPGSEQDVYLVLDEFGNLKSAWRERPTSKTRNSKVLLTIC
jgi:hypothetical protein